jgi:hypothetical protein
VQTNPRLIFLAIQAACRSIREYEPGSDVFRKPARADLRGPSNIRNPEGRRNVACHSSDERIGSSDEPKQREFSRFDGTNPERRAHRPGGAPLRICAASLFPKYRGGGQQDAACHSSDDPRKKKSLWIIFCVLLLGLRRPVRRPFSSRVSEPISGKQCFAAELERRPKFRRETPEVE